MIYAYDRGVKYGIQFRHYPRMSECAIYALGIAPDYDDKPELSQDNLMGEGFAYKHPMDNFCKETGRKISLARAIKGCGKLDPIMSDKEFRTQMWNAYLNRNAKKPVAEFLTPDEGC